MVPSIEKSYSNYRAERSQKLTDIKRLDVIEDRLAGRVSPYVHNR
jgi:hypothetical protein